MRRKADMKGNRVAVEIMNDTYTLMGDSSPEYIQKVAQYVDQDLKKLREKQPRLARNRLLVLALMNMTERFFSEREKGDALHDECRKIQRELKGLKNYVKQQKKDGEEGGGA